MNIVIREISGIRIINTDNGKSFSISSNTCPVLARNNPENVTLISDPVFSEKAKMLPLRSSNDKIVIKDR
jgi:hypothetical protein